MRAGLLPQNTPLLSPILLYSTLRKPENLHQLKQFFFQWKYSLLNLQFNSINNPELQQIFEESQDRIKAMALVHEKLYQSKDLNHINFAEYLTYQIKNNYK